MNYRKANINDNKLLSNLHINVFEGFFLSSLGYDFLKTYYKVVLKHPETICVLAENDQGDVCGIVLGRINAEGYLKRILLSAVPTFCLQGLKLLFTRPSALIHLAKNLEKKNRKGENATNNKQNYAEIGLIGVTPEFMGQKIGRKLLTKFEQMVKEQDVHCISLTTDHSNNEDVLAAYKAWGFEVLYEFVAYPHRRMYRLIKQIN